jgi:hypothetical protein
MDRFMLQLHPQGATLVLPEADKTNGIRWIAKKGHTSVENMIYVGDAMSDYNCLDLVPFPACPSNADERIKELVKSKHGYVSLKHTLEGSLDILVNFAPMVDDILKRRRKKGLYAVVYDFDGCLFDKYETFVESGQKKFLGRFSELVRSCEGPYSTLPFVTLNTGASVDILLKYTQRV